MTFQKSKMVDHSKSETPQIQRLTSLVRDEIMLALLSLQALAEMQQISPSWFLKNVLEEIGGKILSLGEMLDPFLNTAGEVEKDVFPNTIYSFSYERGKTISLNPVSGDLTISFVDNDAIESVTTHLTPIENGIMLTLMKVGKNVHVYVNLWSTSKKIDVLNISKSEAAALLRPHIAHIREKLNKLGISDPIIYNLLGVGYSLTNPKHSR